ncbi:RsmB/NOP family class I SAM-dependent RNA methyltransferase [bacterium]|nr:RsmB/NOP family class I SAM-dependent RNA methyltransferase [bacterium]
MDIQDLASQAIGRAVDVRPGQAVWDQCAGAGGKTLQLAAAAGTEGAVHATDIHQGRLRDLERRVKRAGLANVTVEHWDGAEAPEAVAAVIAAGGYPRVLVDAPCSGSGTWRRNPDGRLRDLDRAVGELNAVQRGLLERAAPAVAPGGLLIYATCSWLPEEDEAVTDAFLADHPEFTLRRRACAGLPHADSDTTFAAVLERKAAGT